MTYYKKYVKIKTIGLIDAREIKKYINGALWRVLIWTTAVSILKTSNVKIFRVMKLTGNISTVCFASAPFIQWAINAAEILYIAIME